MPSQVQKIQQRPTAFSFFEWFGELAIFVGRMFRAALVPPAPPPGPRSEGTAPHVTALHGPARELAVPSRA